MNKTEVAMLSGYWETIKYDQTGLTVKIALSYEFILFQKVQRYNFDNIELIILSALYKLSKPYISRLEKSIWI